LKSQPHDAKAAAFAQGVFGLSRNKRAGLLQEHNKRINALKTGVKALRQGPAPP
jgi:hypothetical protein